MEYSTFNDGTATRIAPIINGCWTLAGGHGRIEREEIVRVMGEHAARGLTTFDTADIYGPSEATLGVFRELWGTSRSGEEDRPEDVQIFTKFVPNIFRVVPDRKFVRASIDRSRAALRMEELDLVQLHWWDYSVDGLLEVANSLMELKEEGIIKSIGVTNMNLDSLQKLVDAGISITCNQVQFSLLDTRPLRSGMMEYCRERNIKIFSYGTLAGGLLSDRHVEEREAGGSGGGGGRGGGSLFDFGGSLPSFSRTPPPPPLTTSSLKMYWRTVQEAGGRDYWKHLLLTVSKIAKKHGVSVADVALRWAIEAGPVHPIVGMRNSSHIDDNLRALSFSLDADDHIQISEAQKSAKGPQGDCYDMERS